MRRYKRVIKKKLGQMLIESGIITKEELDTALAEHKLGGKLLGETLVDLGSATEEEITAAISAQYGIPYLALDHYEIDPVIIRLVPKQLAVKHRCIPLDRMGDILTLVIDNPLDEEAWKELEEESGVTLRCFTSTSANILDAIKKFYGIKIPEYVDLEEAMAAEDEGKKISTFTISENGLVKDKG